MSKTKKLLNFKLITLAICIALSLFGIYNLFFKNRTSKSSNPIVSPATEEEKKQADDNKNKIVQDLAKNKESSAGNNSKKISVTPIVTNTDNGEVNVLINGVFEDDGICTAIFTKDNQEKTKSSTGFKNVSYTQCAPITLEKGFLSPGKWNLIVRYASLNAEGASKKIVFEGI